MCTVYREIPNLALKVPDLDVKTLRSTLSQSTLHRLQKQYLNESDATKLKCFSSPALSSSRKNVNQKPHHTRNASFDSPNRRRATIGYNTLVQRSGAKFVKETLINLQNLSRSAASGANSTQNPPEVEVQLLLQLASDAYYQVIMRKYQAVEILTIARSTFPEIDSTCGKILEQLQLADARV